MAGRDVIASVVGFLAAMLIVQAMLFVWAVSQSGRSLPGQSPARLGMTVALDLSTYAEGALGPTAQLGQTGDIRVVLLNVVRPATDLGHVVADSDEARVAYARAERLMYLDEKAQELRAQGLAVQT